MKFMLPFVVLLVSVAVTTAIQKGIPGYEVVSLHPNYFGKGVGKSVRYDYRFIPDVRFIRPTKLLGAGHAIGHGVGHGVGLGHGLAHHGLGHHGVGHLGHGLGHHGLGHGVGHLGHGLGHHGLGHGIGQLGHGIGHHGLGHGLGHHHGGNLGHLPFVGGNLGGLGKLPFVG